MPMYDVPGIGTGGSATDVELYMESIRLCESDISNNIGCVFFV